MTTATDAARLVADLRAGRSGTELVNIRKRLVPGEEAIGMRMRHLFDVAKQYTDLPLHEVDVLLDHPAYEPRMAAMCILDFRARQRLDDDARRQLAHIYLGRHDRITTWDMVDRAAPRVLGGHLLGADPTPLWDLAVAADPLRRRSAITAPLYFVRAGSAQDVAVGLAIARELVCDPEPVVNAAVGIFLKHTSIRDPSTVHDFLDHHAAVMPRSALRLAIGRLDPSDRAHYLALRHDEDPNSR